jgi:CMP-N-acetylneuraminic acid synthetase
MFTPEVLKKSKNRFGDKIGLVEMDFWKMFEIDSKDDFKMCEAIMNKFLNNE